jgi:hypothetical protein
LQEYGNISWNAGQNVPLDSNVQLEDFEKYDKKAKKALSKKNEPVVPMLDILTPI